MPQVVRRCAVTAAATGALMAGCGRSTQDADDRSPAPARTMVQVTNGNFYDMNVFLVRYGERYRLGLVPGNGVTRSFAFPSNWVTGGPVQFVADPVGGSGERYTQELDVRAGDVVRIQILP